MRPARRVFLKRAVPAVLLFAAVQTFVTREHGWDIRLWVTERGEAAGCAVFRSRAYMVGEDGPFLGDDLPHAVWNFLWRHSTLIVASAAGLATAVGAYCVAAGPLGRSRVFGYRGPSVCGLCGYPLVGLAEARCPECGRSV